MKVTYLGKKDSMVAHGYDFSDRQVVDVPETDKRSTKKFLGNRFFQCEHKDNFVAPKYYAHEIQNIRLPNDDLGNPRYRKIRTGIKGMGFPSMDAAEKWVQMNGRLEQTHYIKKSNDGILFPIEEPAILAGVFRLKGNGEPKSKPEQTFEGPDAKEQAENWMAKNPGNFQVMVK